MLDHHDRPATSYLISYCCVFHLFWMSPFKFLFFPFSMQVAAVRALEKLEMAELDVKKSEARESVDMLAFAQRLRLEKEWKQTRALQAQTAAAMSFEQQHGQNASMMNISQNPGGVYPGAAAAGVPFEPPLHPESADETLRVNQPIARATRLAAKALIATEVDICVDLGKYLEGIGKTVSFARSSARLGSGRPAFSNVDVFGRTLLMEMLGSVVHRDDLAPETLYFIDY